MMQEVDKKRARAIVAAVQRPSVSDAEFDASLTELRQLAKTLGFEVVGKFTQKRAGFDKTAYFGTGKREELKGQILENHAEIILIDHEISPSQAFNLGKEAGCEVMDRTMVILEIFHRHASSRFARAQVEIARVALVGYTNAGKSTLMRALTGSEALVADKLFATLDTTVRALQPESIPRVLVSDTVGFIKNLPHGLVASFKSTLDEALEASLLVHVVDASDAGFERQLAVTEEVLDEIGAEDLPRLVVFNKIDRGGDEAALRAKYPGCVVISARREADIARLREAIEAFFQKRLVEAELFLPWSAQKERGHIFDTCTVLEERADGEGVVLRVRGEPEAVKRLIAQFGEQFGRR